MQRPLLTIPILVLTVGLTATGCTHSLSFGHGDAVEGSGIAKSQIRDTEPFKNVRLIGSPDVDLEIGSDFSVVVEADDNIIDLIQTRVSGRTLEISPKESFSSRTPVRVRITAPELSGVHVTGSGDVSISGLDAEIFEASVTGSGDIRASGTAREVEASVKGSGDLWLEDLKAGTVIATVYGSGDIRVHALQSFAGKIFGSGDIVYAGSPTVVRDSVKGSGDIIAR